MGHKALLQEFYGKDQLLDGNHDFRPSLVVLDDPEGPNLDPLSLS